MIDDPNSRIRNYLRSVAGPGCVPVLSVVLICLFCSNLYAASPAEFFQSSTSLPAREIKQRVPETPEWKKIWDEARQLTRRGDYISSVVLYEKLLALRPKLEEGRWELAIILIKSQEWDRAASVLELLVEADPDRVDYLNGLALVMKEKSFYGRAVDLFSKAHEKDPANLTSLSGLIQALVEVGRREEALPLLEELYQKKPDDRNIRRDLANLAFGLGRYKLARPHMVDLASAPDADLNILLMAARVHDHLGLDKQANKYWQQVIKKDPGNREGHGRLALYYEKRGLKDKALYHLLLLLEKNPDNPSLLNWICRIYVQTDRFAEALPYFERYVAERPGDQRALESILNINAALGNDAIPLYRRLLAINPDDPEVIDVLANDLLAIGDQEGAMFMFEHIARLTPDNPDIYRAIAAMHQRLGQQDNYRSALEKVVTLAPDDMGSMLKLARQYLESGRLAESQSCFLKLSEAGACNEECLESRVLLHERLWEDSYALTDYESLLAEKKDLEEIRVNCVKLAGALGRTKVLWGHLAVLYEGDLPTAPPPDLKIRLAAATALAEAGVYVDALREYRNILSTLAGDDNLSAEEKVRFALSTYMGIADLYEARNLPYEAEQILRQAYNQGCDPEKVLTRLFLLSLKNDWEEYSDAGIWFDEIVSLLGPVARQVRLLEVELMAARGAEREALKLGRGLMADIGVELEQVADPDLREELLAENLKVGMVLGRLLLKAEKFSEAEKYLSKMILAHNDLGPLVLLQKLYLRTENHEALREVNHRLYADRKDGGYWLRLARLYDLYEMPEEMLTAAAFALDALPDSTKPLLMFVKGREQSGDFGEAVAFVDKVLKIEPDNIPAQVILARLFFRMGKFKKAEQQCEKVLALDPQRVDLFFLKMRIFWATDNRIESDLIQKRFISAPIEENIEKAGRELGFEVVSSPDKRSFWEMVTFAKRPLQSYTDKVMSPSHFLDRDSESKRRLNELATAWFVSYKWAQDFVGEGLSRQP
ncbi:MAG: tetratricopeptide repeat protein [Proteobacteria bacterium]|nr:tetratricopeptide repeat protein [Pseudomonadota bacterium]MBU1716082.1 tetratricopeptide repeat protein [Pseudomonadota bacterium]